RCAMPASGLMIRSRSSLIPARPITGNCGDFPTIGRGSAPTTTISASSVISAMFRTTDRGLCGNSSLRLLHEIMEKRAHSDDHGCCRRGVELFDGARRGVGQIRLQYPPGDAWPSPP